MALAETARLVVDLSLKGNFARDLRKTSGALGQFEARIDRTESRAFRAGQQIGTGIKRGAAIAAVGVGHPRAERRARAAVAHRPRGADRHHQRGHQVDRRRRGCHRDRGPGKLAEEFESVNAPVRGRGHPVGREHAAGVHQHPQEGVQARPAGGARPEHRDGRARGLASDGQARRHGAERSDQGLGRAVRGPASSSPKRRSSASSTSRRRASSTRRRPSSWPRSTSGSAGECGVRRRDRRKVAKFHDAIEDLQRTLAAGLLPVVGNIADALTDLFADPAIQQGVADFGEGPRQAADAGCHQVGHHRDQELRRRRGARVQGRGRCGRTLIGAFDKLPPTCVTCSSGHSRSTS